LWRGNVGELLQDADDVVVSEMLHHHHPCRDEVVVSDVDGLRDDVEVQELPTTVGVRLAMVFDNVADDVDSGVDDVGARLKESTADLRKERPEGELVPRFS